MATKPALTTVLGLMLLSGLVQAVLICRATTTSLDAIWFVRLAQQIEQQGVAPAIATGREPLFPVWLWAVHKAVRGTAGPFSLEWAVSAQLAAAAALVFAVVPVYFISIHLVGNPAALGGAVLFCVLPEVARLGADGVSDSTCLLFFSLAFWVVVEFFARGSAGGACAASGSCRIEQGMRLFGAGVATALATLARSESVVLPLALLTTIGLFQFQRSRRLPWLRLLEHACCFAVGFMLSYIAGCAAANALGWGELQSPAIAATGERPAVVQAGSEPLWELPDGQPMAFDAKEPTATIRRRGYGPAVVEFGKELAELFGYWPGLLAALGLWQLRRRPPSAADRFIQILLLLFTVGVIWHTANEGYLSARHLLVWVVAGIGCAGHGALEAGKGSRVLFHFGRRALSQSERGCGQDGKRLPAPLRPMRSGRSGELSAAAAILLATVALCGLQWIKPLHASRTGHRQAAEWLATEATVPGHVFDSHGFSSLYSGRATYPPDALRAATCDPHLVYLVLESQELDFDSVRSRTLRSLIATAAEPVAAFPAGGPEGSRQRVVIYRWHADRFLRWLSAHTAGKGTKHRHARFGERIHPERG